MNAFPLKTKDLLPSLQAVLKNPDGTVADLSAAAGVVFNMAEDRTDGAVIISRAAATIVDAGGGVVRYDWAAGTTDVAGAYRAEFEVTYAGAKPMTYPGKGYIAVNIMPDLA